LDISNWFLGLFFMSIIFGYLFVKIDHDSKMQDPIFFLSLVIGFLWGYYYFESWESGVGAALLMMVSEFVVEGIIKKINEVVQKVRGVHSKRKEIGFVTRLLGELNSITSGGTCRYCNRDEYKYGYCEKHYKTIKESDKTRL